MKPNFFIFSLFIIFRHFFLVCFFLFFNVFIYLFFSFQAFVQGFNKRCFLRRRCSWRCGVLTTQGGIAGIGLGRLLGREHDSTPQSGVQAPRLLQRSFPRLYYYCCCLCVMWCVLWCVWLCVLLFHSHFDACDVTTKLAPDAPSPRRVLTQKTSQELCTPIQAQSPPRVSPSSMNSGAIFMRRPPSPNSAARCCRSARCC